MGRFAELTIKNNEQPFIEEKSAGRFSHLVPQNPQATPEQARVRAKTALDLAKEHKMPVSDTMQFVALPEPSLFGQQIQKIKSFINEKTGYFEPPIYGEEFREENKLKTIAQYGARSAAEFASGLSMMTADVLTNKITGDRTLAELVDRVSGFEPRPREVAAGTMVKYLGAFKTASTGIGAGVSRIPAAQALKTILSSGLTFGSVEAAMQFSKNITEGKPVDWSQVHYASGIGVLWGTGEAVVAATMSGLIKAMDKYWGEKGIDLIDRLTPMVTSDGRILTSAEIKAARAAKANAIKAEIKADVSRARQVYKETGKMPDDLMEKYVYGKPAQKSAMAAPEAATKPTTTKPATPTKTAQAIEKIVPATPLTETGKVISEIEGALISGKEAGFINVEPLQKVVDVAIDTTQAVGMTGKSVVDIVKNNLSRVSGVLNNLGKEGKKLSAQIADTAGSGTRGLDWRIQKVFNNSAIKMDEALKGLSADEIRLVTKLTNHRISPNEKGVTPEIIRRSEMYRAVLDELQTEYTVTGGQRKVKGKWLSMLPTGKGDAHPHVLSEEGMKAVEGAYSKGAKDAKAFKAAQEMVAEGRAESVADAIKQMVRFKKAQLEGLDPYFMSTRLDMPTEYIEWNARKFMHNFLWKKWTLIEAQRIWGARGFPKLEVTLKKIGNEFGSQIEDKLRTYIRVEFGLQESPGSPASKFITRGIRRYQAAKGTATNVVNIIANALEGVVKGYKIGGLSTLARSYVELPPFASGWIKSATELRKTLVKFGGIPDYMGVMPETNLGVKSGGIGTVRSLVEEGSYRRVALVKLLSLERDVKLLRDINPDRTRGLERYTALIKASMGGGERALERLQKAGFNSKRIEELLKLSNEELANVFVDTKGRDAEVIGASLYRAVRDEMFPRTLATKNIWMNANSMAEWLKTAFQFKTWQIEQLKNIAQSAKKAALPPKGEKRDIGQFIRFMIGLGIAGELQNILRDWIFDSEKSVLYQAKSGDTDTGKIIDAIKNDLVAGGFGPIIANIMYGFEDLLLGPAKATAGKLSVLGGEIIRNPKLAPQAIAKFAKKEAPAIRLAGSLINKIDSQLNSQNVTGEYNLWRSRAGEWADKQKLVTVKDKATKIYERIFETIGYGKTERTFPLQLAAEQITKGDITDAADYLRIVLGDSKGEERSDLITGIKVSMNSHSPLGFIPKDNRKEYLGQLSASDKKEILTLQSKWTNNYKTALNMAKAK